MARVRKNPFASILDEPASHQSAPPLDYTPKGASRSILNSLDEIAARADKLTEGETIVELDPDLIDDSFVRDRRNHDEQEFNELLEAIRTNGQDSPILVRPHPTASGRYMTVFGHRRRRVAKALGRKVRAIVKEMQDREHVLSLGHENSARANVPFIERALFAADLARLRYDDDNATILSALSIDRTTLSKMLSVATIPESILAAVGEAKNVGRDRWYELKLQLDNPTKLAAALSAVEEEEFLALSSDVRFESLVKRLKSAGTKKRVSTEVNKRNWVPKDNTLSADIVADGKRFTLAIKARSGDARAFGDFLSENLDNLYEAFRQGTVAKQDGG
ncbi:MAG: plasmid partitioning protein RepB [Mesorhizobium sp.]|nr:plasmid partitioning protein RepB [Mesorhizobium sp.]MCO5164737.1 plasmid partitioning protein RepB [Mesorhizobium sp.]